MPNHVTKKRIAVIGAGVSGNFAARMLSEQHEVELFEAQNHLGGHAETVEVHLEGRSYQVDTGFMVFNDRTYPEFRKLLNWLNVPDQPSDMSFSVQCSRTGLEYQGSSLNGLFAQRLNLLSPRFLKLLTEILRFNRIAKSIIRGEIEEEETTLDGFLIKHRFSKSLRDQYLIPMTAAIWSAPPQSMHEYPARFLLNFLENHGLLQIRDRPQWKTIPGGSKNYVSQLLSPLISQGKVHLNKPIKELVRDTNGISVILHSGEEHHFDMAVVAIHADQALQILSNPTKEESRLLNCFPYQANLAVLHTDQSLLPKRKRAWASWNYHAPKDHSQPVSVTYDVNRLQKLGCPHPILVTLNPNKPIKPSKIIKEANYQHPLFSSKSITAQRSWKEINGVHRTYFCGAYWGHGFHEDGVQSALRICQLIGEHLQQHKFSLRDELLTTPSPSNLAVAENLLRKAVKHV